MAPRSPTYLRLFHVILTQTDSVNLSRARLSCEFDIYVQEYERIAWAPPRICIFILSYVRLKTVGFDDDLVLRQLTGYPVQLRIREAWLLWHIMTSTQKVKL